MALHVEHHPCIADTLPVFIEDFARQHRHRQPGAASSSACRTLRRSQLLLNIVRAARRPRECTRAWLPPTILPCGQPREFKPPIFARNYPHGFSPILRVNKRDARFPERRPGGRTDNHARDLEPCRQQPVLFRQDRPCAQERAKAHSMPQTTARAWREPYLSQNGTSFACASCKCVRPTRLALYIAVRGVRYSQNVSLLCRAATFALIQAERDMTSARSRIGVPTAVGGVIVVSSRSSGR